MSKAFFLVLSALFIMTGCSSGPKIHPIFKSLKQSPNLKMLHFVTPQLGYCAYGLGSDTVEVSRSQDGGKTWQSVTKSTAFAQAGSFTVSSMGFWNENEGILTGRGGTFFTSDGGSSWSYKNPGQTGGYAWEEYSAKDGRGCLILKPTARRSATALQFHESGEKPGQGPIVSTISNLPLNRAKPIFVNGGTLQWMDDKALVAWCESEIYFTEDSGKSWKTPLAENISPYRNDGDEITALAVLAGPEFRYFAYRKEAKRLEFVISKRGSSPSGFDEEASEALFDGKAGTNVKDLHFFDANRGVVLNGDAVFSTKDGGKTWQLLANLQQEYSHPILEVVNQDLAFVAFQKDSVGINLLEFDPTPK